MLKASQSLDPPLERIFWFEVCAGLDPNSSNNDLVLEAEMVFFKLGVIKAVREALLQSPERRLQQGCLNERAPLHFPSFVYIIGGFAKSIDSAGGPVDLSSNQVRLSLRDF